MNAQSLSISHEIFHILPALFNAGLHIHISFVVFFNSFPKLGRTFTKYANNCAEMLQIYNIAIVTGGGYALLTVTLRHGHYAIKFERNKNKCARKIQRNCINFIC